jgi:hypothetical protein
MLAYIFNMTPFPSKLNTATPKNKGTPEISNNLIF